MPAKKKPAKKSQSAQTKARTTRAPARTAAARPSRRGPKPVEFRLKADPLPIWRDAKADLERWMLTEALQRTGGNMAAAGRVLGITKVAVLHAVRRHGLEELTQGN